MKMTVFWESDEKRAWCISHGEWCCDHADGCSSFEDVGEDTIYTGPKKCRRCQYSDDMKELTATECCDVTGIHVSGQHLFVEGETETHSFWADEIVKVVIDGTPFTTEELFPGLIRHIG